jgi:hypothetical protein
MRLFAIALLLASSATHALTAGPGCILAWDYAQPLPADVDGFRLTINGAVAWTGTPLEASCADAGIATPGEFSAFVYAYNDAGESASSNELIFTYVTGAPINAPTMLRFQP